MRPGAFLLALCCALFLSQADFSAASAQQPPEDDTENVLVTRGGQQYTKRVLRAVADPERGRPARRGSIIVRFRPEATDAQRNSLHQGLGAQNVERLFLPNAVRVKVPQARWAQALAAYRANPRVQYAEPDRIVRATLTPNDRQFSTQWGMTKVNAPQAWDVSQSSSSVRIAILDCGIFSASSAWGDVNGFPNGHPDVAPKVIQEVNFSDAPDVDDFCDHGTHVAGIAAAVTNNGDGVAGLGFNASIVNVKVLDDTGTGTLGWVSNGILWAAGCDTNPCGPRRAEIINMSLGDTISCPAFFQDSVNTAWSRGLVVVAAAGNGGADGIGDNGSDMPGNCANVISVSASTQSDAKASYSNFGADVDVAAPGGDCTVSSCTVGEQIWSANSVGGYSTKIGTSMATPHVAGLAALVWTTCHNTSNQAVVDRILNTANAAAPAGSVHGRIDAAAAVGTSGLPVITSPTPGSALPGASATFTRTSCAGALSYSLWVGSTPGSYSLFSGYMNSASQVVNGLPTNSSTVYVRLWSFFSGSGWLFNDYTYTAAAMAGTKAAITGPTPGTTLAGPSVTFTRDNGVQVLSHSLWVGTAPGSYNLFAGYMGPSQLVTGLPANGSLVYVRLWSYFSDVGWQFNDYTYQAASSGNGKAVIISPTPGSTLHGPSTTFTRSAGSGVLSYSLWVGTAPGAYNIFAGYMSSPSQLVGGIPTNGSTVYVRLWSYFMATGWEFNDYTYVSGP